MENGNERNPFKLGEVPNGIASIDPGSIGKIGSETGNARRGSDSAAAGTGSVGGEPARKRGRPKGSHNKPHTETQASIPLDRDAVTAILFSIHTMLAAATKTPELALDEKEARGIAEAATKVAAFYDVAASAKTIAWANLVSALGVVYGPRVIAIGMRRKHERAKRSDKVTPIRDGVMPPFEFPQPPNGSPTQQ